MQLKTTKKALCNVEVMLKNASIDVRKDNQLVIIPSVFFFFMFDAL